MDLGALLHLLHHPLMLLGNGQRGRVDPLVDHLPLPRLEREQTLSCVTHPAPGTHTQRQGEVHTLWSRSLSDCWFTNMHGWMLQRERETQIHSTHAHTHELGDTVDKQRHIRRCTCHIIAWRAPRRMLIPWDVLLIRSRFVKVLWHFHN